MHKLNYKQFLEEDEITISIVSSTDKAVKALENLDSKLDTTMSKFETLAGLIKNIKDNFGEFRSTLKDISGDFKDLKDATNSTAFGFKSIMEATNGTGRKFTSITNGIYKGSENANKQIKNTNKGVKESENIFSSWSKTLTGTLVRYRIISSAIKSLLGTVMTFVDKASGYEEAVNLFAVSMGDYYDSAREWSSRISDALFLDPTTVYQYSGALNSLIKGLDVSADKAYLMSTNLTQLAFDMSSYLNIDYERAYSKIQSGISGQIKGLREVGVALNQATLEQLAYSLGISKSVSDMTEGEKAQLRYIQIMRSTTHMQGDLGRTLMTPANAIRVLKQQFQLLGQAIGRMFLPIIQKVIPYLMALTQVLTNLANKIAKFFGYTPTEVDYSSLRDTSIVLDDVGASADKAGKKVKNMLAPFDDLNVVMSDTAGAGAGAGALGNVDFTPWLDGYDMLEGYTDAFKKKTEELIPVMEKLLKVLGVIFGAWMLGKIASFIASFGNLKNAIAKGDGAFTVLGKTLVKMGSNFTTAFKAAGGFAGGIKAINAGAKAMLGTVGQVVVGFASLGVAIYGGYTSMRDLANGTKNTGEALTKFVAVVGTAAAVATLFISPWAGVAVLLGGIIGGIAGYVKGLQELRDEQEYQKNYNNLFDGQGISLGILNQQLNNIFGPLEKYNKKMLEMSNEMTKAKEQIDNAKDSVKELQNRIEMGDYTNKAEIIRQLKDAYKDVANAIIESDKAEQSRQQLQLQRLKDEGLITQQTYQNNLDALKKYTAYRAAEAQGYTQELADLDAKLATNRISQEEYNSEVEKLASKYALVSTSSDDLRMNLDILYRASKDGFDLKNPEAFKDALDKLKTKQENLMQTTTDAYNASHEQNKIKLAEYDIQMEKLEKLGQKETDTYTNLQEVRDGLYKQDVKITKAYQKDMELIGGTFKDINLTLLAQLEAAHLDGNKKFKDTTKEIKGNLDDLAKYDYKDSEIKVFDSFISNGTKTFGKFKTTQIDEFKKYGIDFADEMVNNLLTQSELNIKKNKEQLAKSSAELASHGSNAAGKSINEGLSKGMESNAHIVEDSVNKVCRKIEDSGKKSLEINSPSHVFQRQGSSIDEGLAKGIMDNTSMVTNSLSSMIKSVNASVKKSPIEFPINTNVEKSFNSMLSKLQTFCNNWRNAINDLAKHMKSTMNGIKVDNGGKISYTSMPKIDVKKFKDGGFPTSGDFFFANEDGRAEYITSIGNRTAVANQDQMVSALTNAIMAGMSRIPISGDRGDTIVYIGNDKVYKGQGEYQSRQTDRYGATTIKV